MTINKTSIETESLPSTPDGFETARYPVFADIQMPTGFVPLHIKAAEADQTLCGQTHEIPGQSLADAEFEEYDYGPIEWTEARDDICDECVTKFAATVATTPEELPQGAIADLVASVEQEAADLQTCGWSEQAALEVARGNVLSEMEVRSDLPWDVDRDLVETALDAALNHESEESE